MDKSVEDYGDVCVHRYLRIHCDYCSGRTLRADKSDGQPTCVDCGHPPCDLAHPDGCPVTVPHCGDWVCDCHESKCEFPSLPEVEPCPWCGAIVDREDEWGSIIVHKEPCYWRNIHGDLIGGGTGVRVLNSEKAAWNTRVRANKANSPSESVEVAARECPSCKVHPHRQACSLNCEDARIASALTRSHSHKEPYAIFEAGWNAGFQEAQETDRSPWQNRCEVRFKELFPTLTAHSQVDRDAVLDEAIQIVKLAKDANVSDMRDLRANGTPYGKFSSFIGEDERIIAALEAAKSATK